MVTPSSSASRKVRQRHAARLRRLTEDHVPGLAVQRPPVTDAAFQRSPDAIARERVWVGYLQMLQRRNRLHGGIVRENRQQQRLPDPGKRIGDGAAAVGLALRRKARISFDPPPGPLVESGRGGGSALATKMTVLHVNSHLLVSNGFARHGETSVGYRDFDRTGLQRPAPAPSFPGEDNRAAGFSLHPGYARLPTEPSGQLGYWHLTRWLLLNSFDRPLVGV